jgi:hypothetical protein
MTSNEKPFFNETIYNFLLLFFGEYVNENGLTKYQNYFENSKCVFSKIHVNFFCFSFHFVISHKKAKLVKNAKNKEELAKSLAYDPKFLKYLKHESSLEDDQVHIFNLPLSFLFTRTYSKL